MVKSALLRVPPVRLTSERHISFRDSPVPIQAEEDTERANFKSLLFAMSSYLARILAPLPRRHKFTSPEPETVFLRLDLLRDIAFRVAFVGKSVAISYKPAVEVNVAQITDAEQTAVTVALCAFASDCPVTYFGFQSSGRDKATAVAFAGGVLTSLVCLRGVNALKPDSLS